MRNGTRIDIEDVQIVAEAPSDELLDVHESLDAFAARYPQKAELVKLRYFAGLTIPQAAEVLRISTPTAERYWASARVWLFREITRRKRSERA